MAPALHPVRLSASPDAEGFRPVESRRRWHRHPARALKAVPTDLVRLCFNCLANDHVKADCTFASRCHTCRREGHRAHDCPYAMHHDAKRGRSPSCHWGVTRGASRRRSAPDDGPATGTPSARSTSTGRSPSVPPCCPPSSPNPVAPDANVAQMAAPPLPPSGGIEDGPRIELVIVCGRTA